MLISLDAIIAFSPKDEKIAHQLSLQLRGYGLLVLPHDYSFGKAKYPELYFAKAPNAPYIIITSSDSFKSQAFKSFVLKVLDEKKPIINIVLDARLENEIGEESEIECIELEYTKPNIDKLARLLKGEYAEDELAGAFPKIDVKGKEIRSIDLQEEIIPRSSIYDSEATEGNISEEIEEPEKEHKNNVIPEASIEPDQTDISIKEDNETDLMESEALSPSENENMQNCCDLGTKQEKIEIESYVPESSYPDGADSLADETNYTHTVSIESGNNSKKKKTIVILSSIVVLLILGFCIWKSLISSGEHKVETDDYAQETYDNGKDSVVEEVYESHEEENEFPVIETSAEAYDVYADLMTDEILGDDWMSNNIMKINSEQGLQNKSVIGNGNINGKPVYFEGLVWEDHRIYGRYFHSNGTKQDVNGVEDCKGNLILKLGHGDDVSFWVLHRDDYEDYKDAAQYSGTWGNTNLNTEVRCVFNERIPLNHHKWEGAAVINEDSYPFVLEFNQTGVGITNAKYINSNYNTTAKLNEAYLQNGIYYFIGKLGGKDLRISFSESSGVGKMSHGDNEVYIEMDLP